MSTIVVERRSDRNRAVERPAAGKAAARNVEAAAAQDAPHRLRLAGGGAPGTALRVEAVNAEAEVFVVVLVEAVLAVEPDTSESRIHDEVDDAGDRVRAVHRRGTA